MGLEVAADSSPSSAESNFRELDDVFLQTQTRIWLGEVLHIRLDEQLNISNLLADGDLLFEVSKVVWKMLLTKCMELRHIKAHKYKSFASRKSSGRYLPYSNVDSFLKICKILGLSGIDLFSPSDVVEKKNTRKVCICIRSLSKKARSKHLNVPDFDIVTYAVSMPTDMVGCIRRSLELSQCSFLSSASYSPDKDSTARCRQKNSVAAGVGNYDSYTEEFDDTESNHMVGSHSSSTNYSYDTAFLMNSDLENSPGVSSVVKSCTLAPSVLQSDIEDHETDEYAQGEYESHCLAESFRTPCSQHVKDDTQPDSTPSPLCVSSQIKLSRHSHINDSVRHSHNNYAPDLIDSDHDLGTGASIDRDSVDDNTSERSYIARHLAISDFIGRRSDNSNPVLFDGEDSMYNVYLGTDSHGSNLTQKTSENGFGMGFYDEIEDVEVSSVASMSSVSDRVLNLEFEDQFDAEDDFNTFKVQFHESQSGKADLFEKRHMQVCEYQERVKNETVVITSNPGTEKPQSDMKHENIGFSTKLSQPCLNMQSHASGYPDNVSYDNGICISQINSNVVNDEGKLLSNLAGCLYNKDFLKNVDWDEVTGSMLGQSHSPFDFHKWNEKHNCATELVSYGNDGHGASPKFVSSEGIDKEYLYRSLSKASGHVWLKDMESIVADDKEICNSNVVKSDSDTKEHPNNFSQAACFNDNIEIAYEDSNTSAIAVVEESEICRKLSSTDDDSDLEHQLTSQDINGCGRHIPDTVAVCDPSLLHNFVLPCNTDEPAPKEHTCLTIECLEDVGEEGDQACTHHNKSHLYCAEKMDKLNYQDKRKQEKVNMSKVEILDERKENVGLPQCKGQRRPLLKSVIGGTAVFGVLFLFLHFRRSGGEKAGEASIQSSQIRQANGMEFSSQKGQKGLRVNGVYPAEKLNFED